ncbi:MAG: hypothetical protein EOO21_06025 [Comamonadaceae bacterium]|nr:MAG: hypothetical protein EOO21_06025 [Comamonadaceae bacterium]
MKVRTLLLILVLLAIVLFTALNWTVFTTPSTLSLLVATVEAPLGVIMLGLLVLLTGLFMIFAGYLQTSTLPLRGFLDAAALADDPEIAEHYFGQT